MTSRVSSLTDAQQRLWLPMFIDGYITAMLWANTLTEDGEYDDAREHVDLVTDAAIQQATDDCLDFMEAQWADLRDLNPIQCGHDFALTRNRHGAGFWDRGYGARGDRLTEASHPYGEQHWLHCGATIEVLG